MSDTGSKKIGLIGFSRVTLFPVLKNDTEGYETGGKLPLPWAQEMTRESDTSETKVYADDTLYANVKIWNGMNATLTMVEMPLETFETLGFGTYDEDTETLSWNPQSKNLEFAMTFRSLRLDGKYRMYRMFSFVPTELKESGLKTKSDGTQVITYQLSGMFTARKCDDLPGAVHDGDDMAWLDTIPPVPAP